MKDYLVPHIDILPQQQKKLWPELKQTPNSFVLYGGTALALRFGHRISVDFDFFSNKPFDPEQLFHQIPYLKNADIQQLEKNTLTCSINRGGAVQVSFFGGLDLGCINEPSYIKENGLAIASALDIGAAKARVILTRPSWKDYVDLDTILQNGEDLTTILSATQSLYQEPYSPILSLKALTFYDDLGEELSSEAKKRLSMAAKEVKIENLKFFSVKKNIRLQKEQGICI